MGQLSVVGSILFYVGTFGLSGLICRMNIKNNVIKLFLVIIPPVFLATFRYNIGYDYGSYVLNYDNSFDITYESIIAGYETGDPIAFYLITKIATVFNSERAYLMILAILSLIPGISYILREWNDVDIQQMIIFIYMFSPFIFSLSACKQGIALGFLMFSLKFVYERKPIRFVLFVAVAFLFHSTAIVFLLVYFFINDGGDLSTLKKVLIVVGCLFIIMNLQWVLGNVMNGRYETYAVDAVEGRNRTFWLYSLITIIFFIFRTELIAIDKRNDLLIMMMAVGAICQYLGFSNAFAKRIGEYFLMVQVFLIPQCIFLFNDNSKKIAKLLIFIYVVVIFLIASPTASSGMGFVPYQFKFW
ncbi:EpsG family protein [Blautia schinkii]|nr:EpsG family protein [Blautia schinkii]